MTSFPRLATSVLEHCHFQYFLRPIVRSSLAAVLLLLAAGFARGGETLRAGIIGCDTSHVPAFAKVLNADDAEGPLANVRVVAAYPGGSDDIPSSHDRVEGFTNDLREMGIEITDSIDALLERVDVVLLESVDGRPHLEQARPVLAAGKPLFIDKPLAGSLADAVEIFALAEKHGTPCFSASSLRYSPATEAARQEEKIGKLLGCAAYSPCSLEPHHPDLFWYGVHGVETLFTIMGPGCQQVTRVQTDDTELVVGVWADGRIGTFRGLRAGKRDYGATLFGSKAIEHVGGYKGYQPLVVAMAQFFATGKPPVSAEETLEIFAFMEAADESKRQGGAPVTIESVLEKARKQVAER
jgi:Oxidoreductase family, NAD-binding Rossmann fold